MICFIGIFEEYQLNRDIIENSFGALRGKYGLDGNRDISGEIKNYNMKKYSNKLYL